MLDDNQLYRLIVLFVVGVLFWLLSYSEHKKYIIEQEKVYLPKFMLLFFGKPTDENIYNIRGVIGQLFVYTICLVYSLLIIGRIDRSELTRIFLVSSIVLFVIYGMLYFFNKVRRS
jgi:hypothetical protein